MSRNTANDDRKNEPVSDTANQQQQRRQQNMSLDDDSNNSSSSYQELSFTVRLPSEFVYSDSLLYCPQKGRYAFPAGLANERASFGWQLRSDGTHSNVIGNQRTRRFRCASTFFQCDRCLKIITVGDETARTKKRKTTSDDDNDDDDNDAEKKCSDSPQCEGRVRLMNCDVVTNLVVGPFLATMEVSANHLHAQLQSENYHQQQNLVQITAMHLRTVKRNAGVGDDGVVESGARRQTVVINHLQSPTTIGKFFEFFKHYILKNHIK